MWSSNMPANKALTTVHGSACPRVPKACARLRFYDVETFSPVRQRCAADELEDQPEPSSRLAELANISATRAAAELNRRKIATAAGGKWYAATVIRLRERLNEGGKA